MNRNELEEFVRQETAAWMQSVSPRDIQEVVEAAALESFYRAHGGPAEPESQFVLRRLNLRAKVRQRFGEEALLTWGDRARRGMNAVLDRMRQVR